MPHYGNGKDIFIVDDDSYTHAILMNVPTPSLTIPRDRVIGIAFEPPLFLQVTNSFMTYAKEYIGKYLIGTNQLPPPFHSAYSFLWHTTPPKEIPLKTKLMSIMVSQKTFAPGHQYRHELVQAILSTNFPIDIYGRGAKMYFQDSRLKGEFVSDEPYQSYQFHICIENYSISDYTSEKYTNPLLWGTTPIYWGAQKPLFPEYTIQLSGDVIKDMLLIRKILANPEEYQREISQEVVRSRLNILNHLDELFSPL
jgi:hypothetical protein